MFFLILCIRQIRILLITSFPKPDELLYRAQNVCDVDRVMNGWLISTRLCNTTYALVSNLTSACNWLWVVQFCGQFPQLCHKLFSSPGGLAGAKPIVRFTGKFCCLRVNNPTYPRCYTSKAPNVVPRFYGYEILPPRTSNRMTTPQVLRYWQLHDHRG